MGMDQPAAALAMLNDFMEGKLDKQAVQADACTGDADPSGPMPKCYAGTKEVMGMKETVEVKVTSFADGAGMLDFTASGFKTFTCNDKPFTKDGQEISGNYGSCAPEGVTVTDVKYCSDSDTIYATVKAEGIPVTSTLARSDCPSAG